LRKEYVKILEWGKDSRGAYKAIIEGIYAIKK